MNPAVGLTTHLSNSSWADEDDAVARKPSKITSANGKTSSRRKVNGDAANSKTAKNGNSVDETPEVDENLDDVEDTEEPETNGTTAIDDPVRMYLMQMGEIPMLSREKEVSSAKLIEATRTRFRRTMLANDFVLHGAVELLQKVADGNLRLDRTIEISVTNTAEKKRILKRIQPNLVTIRELLNQNQADFRKAVDRKAISSEKHAAWRRMIVRRNKAVRLVEELNLRLQRLLPLMDQLGEIASRMSTVKQQLSHPERLLACRSAD